MAATSNELSPYRRRTMLQDHLGQFAMAAPRLRSFDAVQAYLQRMHITEAFALAIRCGSGCLRGQMVTASLDVQSEDYSGQGVSVYGGNLCVRRRGDYRYGIHLPAVGQTYALDTTQNLPVGAYSAYWQEGFGKKPIAAYGLPDVAAPIRPSVILLAARQAASDIQQSLCGRCEPVEVLEARLAELPADHLWSPTIGSATTA